MTTLVKTIPLIALAIALLSGCAQENSQSQPEQVAEQYWQAILSGDSESANQLVLEPIELELSHLIQPGNESELYFGTTDIDDNEASVATQLDWVDAGQQVTFSFPTSLTQTRGEWKIDAELTQQHFFDSVYQFSLTDSGLNFLPEPDSEELSPQELDAMLEELEQTTEELHRQRRPQSEENEDLLNLLDQDLQNKINEYN